MKITQRARRRPSQQPEIKVITRLEIDHDFGFRGNRRVTAIHVEGEVDMTQAKRIICDKLGYIAVNEQCVNVVRIELGVPHKMVKGHA